LDRDYLKTIENTTINTPIATKRREKIDMRHLYELKNKSDFNIYTIDWKPMNAIITEKRNDKNDVIISGVIKPANPLI
jgi:hypothetical protein